MDKKRSKGVTILAWLSFMTVLFGLLTFFNYEHRVARWEGIHHITLPLSYHYTVISNNIFTMVSGLIAWITLLKLVKWARIYMIVLSAINIVYDIAFWFVFNISHFVMQSKPEGQTMLYLMYLLVILWQVFIIYFFTRPKVKEQFKP